MAKAFALGQGFLKRFFMLFTAFRYDFVFIHREATPVGPPVIEWLLAKVLKRKVIYDFDDAIWITDREKESRLAKAIKWRSKAGSISRWSHKVSCGNPFLTAYASQFNSRVVKNPTTIPVDKFKRTAQPPNSGESVSIGWTGSHSTLKYLEEIAPALRLIESKYPSTVFLVIADRPPRLDLKNLVFKKWSQETEVSDLLMADIGIMPLPDNEWTKGKCGFKALQYMALEIPAVVSPVGVNTEIVEDGIHGYWCSSENEWFLRLEKLILSREDRLKMGKRGREKVIRYYSIESNASCFLSLFQLL